MLSIKIYNSWRFILKIQKYKKQGTCYADEN
jgi:hypothetical protein